MSGRGFYYKKKFGNDVHGVYIFGSDLRSARNASFSSGLGQVRQICCTSDRDFDLSARAPQSEYTPVVQEIKDQSSSYAQSAGPFNTTVALRKEAKLQGVNTVKVWDCGTQCYDPALIEQGGADVEGQYRRHAVPAVLQRRGPQGEQDGGELLQERRRRQRRTARCAVLVDRRRSRSAMQ